ncbi:MAG: UvrB/UvrC motif-containing protein [Candidatus Paceibacterota bacterium]|jgi:excinuclease ABC subunit C
MVNRLAIKIKKLPDKPGIYLFYNKEKELVYVGKATSLKNRVKSYFSKPKTFRPIEAMMHQVIDVKWQETDSALDALILEANYIKKFYPKYNIKEKDDKSWNYLVITREDFPKLQSMREHQLKEMKGKEKKIFKYIFGPYAQVKTNEVLKLLHSLFKVSRCSVPPTGGSKRPCFDYQLSHCLGVCTNEIDSKTYNEKVIKPLVAFLSGKKKTLIKSLERKMKLASKEQNFEEAKRLRNQIFSLQKIKDFSILDKSFLENANVDVGLKVKRIEGYDISNLGVEAKVGSMVVFDEKGSIKSEYKKFKIKTVEGQSDVDCLKEIIERRLKHDDWGWPQVILVDGGKPQVNVIKKIIKKANKFVFIIGIAKGVERKKNEFIFDETDLSFLKWLKNNENLLIRARDEAHRFAINYQRGLKRKSFK